MPEIGNTESEECDEMFDNYEDYDDENYEADCDWEDYSDGKETL